MAGQIDGPGGYDSPWIRWLIVAALSGSLASGGVSIFRTQDRFYGSDARVMQSEVRYLKERLDKMEARQSIHSDTHPDRGLQIQINELREELIRISVGNAD